MIYSKHAIFGCKNNINTQQVEKELYIMVGNTKNVSIWVMFRLFRNTRSALSVHECTRWSQDSFSSNSYALN